MSGPTIEMLRLMAVITLVAAVLGLIVWQIFRAESGTGKDNRA